MRLWTTLACVVSLVGFGCGTEEPDVGSTTGTTANGSTTDEEGSTSIVTTTVSGSASATVTSASTTTSSTTSDDSSSSSTSSDSRADSSSGDPSATSSTDSTGCTLGTAGCSCDEGACEDGLECTIDDVCEPPEVCTDDEFGNNIDEDSAFFLGEINDNDDNGGTVMGVLVGEDDVDWFRYDGNDVAFQTVDPFRTVTATAGVRFCKFANCGNGIENTEFPCTAGAETVTSPDGRPGCCHDSLIHVPDANCTGTIDDDIAIWIRLDQAEEACVPYAFNYHY